MHGKHLKLISTVTCLLQPVGANLGIGRQEMKTRVRLLATKFRSGRRQAAGFTLLEMLVVLIIIGLVAGLVGPRIFSALSDAKVKTARIEIENLSSAIDMFYLDVGRYPRTEEGLSALVQKPADADDWRGPYLKGNAIPNDPWGHAFIYKTLTDENEPYEIVSNGQDGKASIKAVHLTRK